MNSSHPSSNPNSFAVSDSLKNQSSRTKHMLSYGGGGGRTPFFQNYLAKISQARMLGRKKGILTFHILLNTVTALAITVSYIQINSPPSVKCSDNHRV